MQQNKRILGFISMLGLVIIIAFSIANYTSAHRSPELCTGTGLNISLSTDKSQANVGDLVSFDVNIHNGISVDPVVCDATDIQASIVTPDGVNHPISLIRTSLTNAQQDDYIAIVTYTIRPEDSGVLSVTASVTGAVHQNDTDSSGGGNQGLNITVISPPTTPPDTGTGGSGGGGGGRSGGRRHEPLVIPIQVATTTPVLIYTPSFPNTGYPPKENNSWNFFLNLLIQIFY